MNILDKIVINKRREILELKETTSIRELENLLLFDKARPSFYNFLSKAEPAIIAEFKRKSPSRGIINGNAGVEEVVAGYQKAGASAVSILTDIHFDGKPDDMTQVFGKTELPLLRKDFILDEIQVFEARAMGASAILLIAAILEREEILRLSRLAHTLEMDVLLELHAEEELQKVPEGSKIVGINNRDLKSFRVDLEHSIRLANKLPAEVIKVSESGINSSETLIHLFKEGFSAFLVGENFMKEKDPGLAAEMFIKEIRWEISL